LWIAHDHERLRLNHAGRAGIQNGRRYLGAVDADASETVLGSKVLGARERNNRG
jgi:hypothetical protein